MTKRQELEREVAQLLHEINLKRDQLNALKWQPTDEDQTHIVLGDGSVFNTKPTKHVIDFGCGFKCEADALKASKKYRKYHLLYKLAEELNGSNVTEPFSYWVIQYLGDSDKLVPIRFTEHRNLIPQVFFKSKELAEKAIEIINCGGLE